MIDYMILFQKTSSPGANAPQEYCLNARRAYVTVQGHQRRALLPQHVSSVLVLS